MNVAFSRVAEAMAIMAAVRQMTKHRGTQAPYVQGSSRNEPFQLTMLHL